MDNNWLSGSAGGQPVPQWMNSKAFSGGMGVSSLLNGLFGLLGLNKQTNPADAANRYINQIPGQTQQYYQPYMNAGKSSLDELMKRYGQNAGDIYNEFGSKYTKSPGYNFELEQALNAANNASAAGGSLGTPLHQLEAQKSAQGVASKDFNKYMESVLGLYGGQNQGLQDISKMGYGASSDFAKQLADVFGQQAANVFEGQKGLNEANKGNWEELFKSIPWLASLLGM